MTAGERVCCEVFLSAYASLLFVTWPPLAFASEEKEYRCVPEVKYECGLDRCERMGSDFQHAESFSYNPETGVLSACLWTNCYATRATAVLSENSSSITAIGKLEPRIHGGNDPVVISLTIDNNMDGSGRNPRFTAAWGYRSNGLTLDFGECILQQDDQSG